jgi:hypothetical protein
LYPLSGIKKVYIALITVVLSTLTTLSALPS